MESLLKIINVVIGVLGAVIGVLGIIGSAVLMRLAVPVMAVLIVLEFFNVIQIGWTMVFCYPLIMVVSGLCLYGISFVWTMFFTGSFK